MLSSSTFLPSGLLFSLSAAAQARLIGASLCQRKQLGPPSPIRAELICRR